MRLCIYVARNQAVFTISCSCVPLKGSHTWHLLLYRRPWVQWGCWGGERTSPLMSRSLSSRELVPLGCDRYTHVLFRRDRTAGGLELVFTCPQVGQALVK